MNRSLVHLSWIAAVGVMVAFVSARAPAADEPSSAMLQLLPEGEEKRRFILDCTGCHTMDRARVFPGGRARTESEWRDIVTRMVDNFGASSSFPVIAVRDPAATANWLARHWSTPPAVQARPAVAAIANATVQEFMFPHAQDLPHDVAVEADGRVVVTGMFTHAMQRLNPATGTWEEFPIPVESANPRALEIDDAGNWWVLLGAANRIARYTPASARWDSWPVPFYGHSIRVGPDNRVWTNGHFTKDPELVVALNAGTSAVDTFTIPNDAALRAGAGPIPYGLRVARDGMVWGTELQGGRIFRLDPRTRAVRTWAMPTPKSGPRRPAIASDGGVWIPEYSNDRIARFDTATETFREWVLPLADALPYVIVLDEARGRLWVGTAAADVSLPVSAARRALERRRASRHGRAGAAPGRRRAQRRSVGRLRRIARHPGAHRASARARPAAVSW